MNWFIFALLAALFFSAQRITSRIILREKGDPVAFTMLHDLLSGLFILPLLLFIDVSFPTNPSTWLFFIIATIFFTFGDVFSYKAVHTLDISTYQIINQLRHVFVLLAGFVFYNESLYLLKILGITLIIIGAVITLYHRSIVFHKQYNKGIVFTILSALFISLALATDKTILKDFSFVLYAALSMLGSGVLGSAYLFLTGRGGSLVHECKLQGKGILLAALLFSGYKIFIVFSVASGEVSRVVPVTQSSLIFVVLGGILFLKEYNRLWQKLIGVLVISLGVASLYLF